jgi:hypothetical protein
LKQKLDSHRVCAASLHLLIPLTTPGGAAVGGMADEDRPGEGRPIDVIWAGVATKPGGATILSARIGGVYLPRGPAAPNGPIGPAGAAILAPGNLERLP